MQTEQKHQLNFHTVYIECVEKGRTKKMSDPSIDVDFENRQRGTKKSEIEEKNDKNDEMVS